MSSAKDVIQALPDAQIIETTRVTAITTGVGGWFASMVEWNWTAIVGVSVAILTLVMNWYFSHRRHRIEKAESALRQSLLKAQISAYKEKCSHADHKD